MAKTGSLVMPATILIAEDSADTRAVLMRALAFRGYHVVEAADGREAVEVAESECPDLVLMDLNMPVMDGLAATERIRELRDKCGNIPVVAITAFDTYGMREAAAEVGCNAYLLKPLDLDELESVIAGLLLV
jgi:CheY-like chemotaxis protein